MSYDVDIVSTTNDEWTNHAEFNHTFNTATMMKEAGCYIPDLDNVKCVEASPVLENAINNLENTPERFKPMEAKNKWGTVETTLKFFREIKEACDEHPEATVIVHK